MDPLDLSQIRDFCREAQDLAQQNGPHEGLSFLIGEKFYFQVITLKKAEENVKYLYNPKEDDSDEHLYASGNAAYRESYALAVQNTYQKSLEKIERLKKVCNDFALEIKDAFDLSDIREYLESYPRLGVHAQEEALSAELAENTVPLNISEVLSEADDILMIEMIRKYF